MASRLVIRTEASTTTYAHHIPTAMLLHNLDNSFLAGYRLPRLNFSSAKSLPSELQPVWTALRNQKKKVALRRGYEVLRADDLGKDTRAGLLAAIASAEWDNGVLSVAKQLAYESISFCKTQWLAHRVLLTLHLAENEFETAWRLMDTIEEPKTPKPWDEPLSSLDRHLLRAACAWMTRDWETTAKCLVEAYPDGVTSMPLVLQEDWFRLAFYRARPKDAAAAARQLISDDSPEKADVLIQTLVRQGWHKEALSLYRSIYEQDPTNELLRRRVVGLCIREGEVQEARRLMERGALRLAV